MTTVGYGRVSTADQHPEAQHDALTAAGCDKIFIDKGASGKLASRPRWDACREYLRPGDMLVITRLDRLGRSVKNLLDITEWLSEQGIGLRATEQSIDTSTAEGRLFFTIVAAFAAFEHELIVERTKEGLAAARARGRMGGGVRKLTPAQAKRARELYDAKTMTVKEIGLQFGVSRQTIYRALGQK